MRKIILVFSETALELMPSEMLHHGIIIDEARKRHKKPYELLLDSNKHNLPMRALPNPEKRGRPDIIHFSLLTALDSFAAKKGLVQNVYVHTNSGKLLSFSTETRLPRVYNRFCGIMEQVLSGNSTDFIGISEEKDFGKFFSEKIIKGQNAKDIFFFNEKGADTKLLDFQKTISKSLAKNDPSPIVFIFGAFPRGTFSEEIRDFLLSKDAKEFRFGNETVPVSSLVSLALRFYEAEAGL